MVSIADIDNMISAGELAVAIAMRKSTKKKTARMSVDVELKLIQMFTGSTIGSRY